VLHSPRACLTAQTLAAELSVQGESVDILYGIDERYPEGPALLPVKPAMRAAAKELIGSFRAVMPSGLRPSARTAFLFQAAGQPAGRPVFEATLDAVEEVRYDSCIDGGLRLRVVASSAGMFPDHAQTTLTWETSSHSTLSCSKSPYRFA
jgi:hypothetical protein